MATYKGKFTVFFEDPFWVGVYERVLDDELEVCKIVFGAEPKDYEVYDYLLNKRNRLSFSSFIKIETKEKTKINPKRMHREIKKQMSRQGIGTKSQQALKMQYEENKKFHKNKSQEEKKLEKQLQFELKKKKRKEKHKGR